MTNTNDITTNTLLHTLGQHPLPGICMGLERMQQALTALGSPQASLPPVIHIAGTNGKGSTLAFMRALLEGQGKRVHAYTSPHLVHFHERIGIHGAPIDDATLQPYLQHVLHVRDTLPVALTFFEATTAAAFLAFANIPADYLLLETGLGGRLDATNVVTSPAACVISSISMDHTEFLGTTLTAIAAEKAGIIKPECPVFVATQPDDVMQVLTHTAQMQNAPIYKASEDWQVTPRTLPLLGAHQYDNAALALAVVQHLLPQVEERHLSNAYWPARMMKLENTRYNTKANGRTLWLDGGHNPAAGQAIAAWMHAHKTDTQRPCYVIMSMVSGKDIEAFIAPITPHAAHVYCIPIPEEPSAYPQDALQKRANATPCHNLMHALDEICRISDTNCDIIICGSLYLAGSVLRQQA